LDPKNFKGSLLHFPVIKVVPISDVHLPALDDYSHIIFTSKSTVEIFFSLHPKVGQLRFLSIGPSTSTALKEKGYSSLMAEEATQEGIMKLIVKLNIKKLFLPCSNLARKDLAKFLNEQKIPYTLCYLYQTMFQIPFPPPEINDIEEIVFTSPSTVDGFLKIYPLSSLEGKKIHCIGPITRNYYIETTSRTGILAKLAPGY